MQQSNPFVTFVFSTIPDFTPLGSFLGHILPEYQIERSPPIISMSLLAGDAELIDSISSIKESGCWRKLSEISKEHIKTLSLESCTLSILGKLMILMSTRLECLFRLQYYLAFQQELNQVDSILDSLNLKELSLPTEIRLLKALLPAFSNTDQNNPYLEHSIWSIWKILNESDVDISLVSESIEWISSLSIHRNSPHMAIMLLENLSQNSKYSKFDPLYTTLGKLYLSVRDISSAINLWNNKISSENNIRNQIHQSIIAMFNLDYKLTMNILNKLLMKHPDQIQIHQQIAFVHFIEGRHQQALEQMENIISRYPLQVSRDMSFISNLFHLYDHLSFPKDSKLAVIKALLPYMGDDFDMNHLLNK